MDGNQAAAYISYLFSELAAIYPITPASPMAEQALTWSLAGDRNLFNTPLNVTRSNSEATAVATIHGALKMGIFATTYTSSQGLLLMLPTLYRIAGELLPTVFHVASRSVTTNGQSIFGDHSDVMATRQTGFAILAAGTVQEVMDLAAVAHLATIASSIPFLHFFDGFQTSHQIQTIHELTSTDLKSLIDYDAIKHFRKRGLTTSNPRVTGINQNPDLYFQQRETINAYYDAVSEVTRSYMRKINAIRGTDYDLVNYYGDPEADRIIVAMGAVCITIEATIDYLRQKGERVGYLNVRLYRPFPVSLLRDKLPNTVTRVAVLDRTKEPGSSGEPLLLDVGHALANHKPSLLIIGGRYGLGGKNVTPTHVLSVFHHLSLPVEVIKSQFTVGIYDDVTHLSLPHSLERFTCSSVGYTAKFFGIGSDQTISQTKLLAQEIHMQTGKYVQAMFEHTAHKSGGCTTSHLRFSNEQIKLTHLPEQVDFVSSSCETQVLQYGLINHVRMGGIFLLNTTKTDSELQSCLPYEYKEVMINQHIQFYVINESKQISKIIASTFRLLAVLPETTTGGMMPKMLRKVNVTSEWLRKEDHEKKQQMIPKTKITQLLYNDNGNQISVGDLMKGRLVDGTVPIRDETLMKVSITTHLPKWNEEACTMCNRCAFVCPHSALRPFLADDDELNEAPPVYLTKKLKNKDGHNYRLQIAPYGCTGCSLCVVECPQSNRALTMQPITQGIIEEDNWKFARTLTPKKTNFPRDTVFGSQLQQPLLEFPSACGGCGETIYAKLLTQLFGERLIIANATGCSSIWGASMPYTPYTTNQKGQGPAWATSLFENNAEFGAGMQLATTMRRVEVACKVEQVLKSSNLDLKLKKCLKEWRIGMNQSEGTLERSTALVDALKETLGDNPSLTELYQVRDHFIKPSHWIIGGDGWAYDIGFSGIDHVLTSGNDVNILVLDNEIYANTGGQATKATQVAAITKFTKQGKLTAKKDLGAYAITLGNVYVAQVSYSANPRLLLKILTEAENFPGPALIIAYTPCITHGIIGGMSKSAEHAREAVHCGYWATYHYNPLAEVTMQVDFKQPNFENLEQHLRRERRYIELEQKNPEQAVKLLTTCKSDAKKRFAFLEMIAVNENKKT